jgi:serine/threonine protein kinase
LGLEEYKSLERIQRLWKQRFWLESNCSLSKYLVQLTEFFIEEEYCCLLMEFCTGGDLEKIFNEKNGIPQPVFFLF